MIRRKRGFRNFINLKLVASFENDAFSCERVDILKRETC